MTIKRVIAIMVCIVGVLALTLGLAQAQDAAQTPPGGTITYRSAHDNHLYRLAAVEGAEPEDLTQQLDALGTIGEDDWLNISPDGSWLLMSTERFSAECVGWSCLAVGPAADLTQVATLFYQEGDRLIPIRGEFGAISSDGSKVIFPANDGPNALDLWITQRAGDYWTPPVVLTADATYPYHTFPAFSEDGSKIVFDCSKVPYSQETTGICEMNTDGTGYRIVVTPSDVPAGAGEGTALHHPDYMPAQADADCCGIVFESDWGDAERIWYLAPGAEEPVLLTDQFGNDNSPCVLPDGRIVSLWLDREGSEGYHEIKVMNPVDPADYYMALLDVDVLDIGIGCGAALAE